MKKNEVKSNNNLPQPELLHLGDTAVSNATRDTQLSTFNVDANFIADLQAKTTALRNMPSDDEYKGAEGIATREKNEIAAEVRTAIGSIMVRAKIAFGLHSAEYLSFGTRGLADMTDHELSYSAAKVHRLASVYFSELSAKGLTQPEIDDLETKMNDFNLKIIAKDEAVRARDIATQNRILAGNALYEKITELFDYGKEYWGSRDEAKFNDYIIYGGSPEEAPEEAEYGSVHGTATGSISGDPVVNGLVFLEGVEEAIEVDTEGNWECEMVPVTCTRISATADNCKDYDGAITIVAGEDIVFDFMMDPEEIVPPALP